jgi:hypothetical protein
VVLGYALLILGIGLVWTTAVFSINRDGGRILSFFSPVLLLAGVLVLIGVRMLGRGARLN